MSNYLLILVLLTFQMTVGQDEQPNIILIIADGMGLTQITSGMYAQKNTTVLEEFEFVGLAKTHSLDRLVTDSAASGTAMASGVKTGNGVIGIDGKNSFKQSILEISKERGYKAALVVTSSIVHATPASFYANVNSRNSYETIALQLSEHDVDLFVGGGKKHFTNRKDKRNLIEEMSSYTFVKNLIEFEATEAEKIGFFTYDDEPPSLLEGRKPALNKMVSLSLQKLENQGAPFFMLIEGSQIDWGGHDNDLKYILSEFKEFDKTLREVIDYAKEDGNTLVIVTADHETGGLSLVGGNYKKGRVNGKFNTGGHTATMVPVFSFGPASEKFTGIYENTTIFDKMLQVLNETSD